MPGDGKPAYSRVLLKLSGEALQGPEGYGISPDVLGAIAPETDPADIDPDKPLREQIDLDGHRADRLHADDTPIRVLDPTVAKAAGRAVKEGRIWVYVRDDRPAYWDIKDPVCDIIMAAEKATAEHIAFFVRHTSGVICAISPAAHRFSST